MPVLSYSFLSKWDTCPYQAMRIYIARDLPKEDSEALRWGNLVHDAFRVRINQGTPLPAEMAQYERYCAFGNYVVKAEVKLGMRENGKPCGFFDSDVWLRGAADVVIGQKPSLGMAHLWDWKTGKVREDSEELEIQAVLLKAHRPELERITGRYVWLKEDRLGKEHDLSDTDAKLASLHNRADEIGHMAKMGYFPKKQGPLCGWCPVKDCENHP